MDSETRQAFARMAQMAVQEREGKILMELARSLLFDELERKRFNTSRAREVFGMAIEKAIWKKLGSVGALTTRSIRGSGIVEDLAATETENFLALTGAHDQRPARRGLLAFIIGK